MTAVTATGPVPLEERIHSLDILRGIAVLGILLMNISSFAMIGSAYFNPTAWGDLTGINRTVWTLLHLFADQKFMTIFSILFGAGIVIFAERCEAKGRKPAGLHYRRSFWLLVFGLLHAYLMWFGDILVAYACCAFVVYLFRRLRPGWLLTLGLISISVCFALNIFFGWSKQFWPPEAVEQMRTGMWNPTEELVNKEIAAYQGGFMAQMSMRWISALMIQTQAFLFWGAWRAGGLMLVGMALYKWGVLSARRSRRFYAVMALLGFHIGIPVTLFGVRQQFAHEWSFDYSFFYGMQFNYWGSLFISAGYIGLIIWLGKILPRLAAWPVFSAMGRMAFTNYILQTVICTFIFYGHGLGLFCRVERAGQMVVVLSVWALMLFISPLWLSRFRFGPLEWLWRSLTYWKRQPFWRAEG